MTRLIPLVLALTAAVVLPARAGEGMIRLSQQSPPSVVDLSAGSPADWCHWGLIKGTNVLHRKDAAKPLIGELVKLGNREAHTFENNVTTFAWSGGTPTPELRKTQSGLFTYGKDNGFAVTLPAGTGVRTARVYAGVWRATGRLEAALSDGSAPAVTATLDPDPKGEITNTLFTIVYRAAADGQTLTLRWTNPGTGGNVEFLAVALADGELQAGPVFPLKASESGRYLVDKGGAPFFVHADTGWRAIMALTTDEAKRYFDDRKAKGFTAVHMHIINKEKTGPATRGGAFPFDPKEDLTRPNEAYWQHADAVLQAAADRGLLVVLSSSWFGYNGSGWRKQLTPESAKAYGAFLGNRYKRLDNILWVHAGDNDPGDKADAIAELARAIKAHAPHHLHTAHVHPENASAAHFADADWLDVNMAYTYKEADAQVAAEYARAGKVRPVYFGETGYEGESNTKFLWTPVLVRRQPYRALLSGACGHANGSATIWHFGPGWEKALDMEATRQMVHVKALFTALPWWRLVPDAKGELLTEGRGAPGKADFAPAARTDDGAYAVVYLPTPRPVTIDIARLAGKRHSAWWFNPRDGKATAAELPDGPGPHRVRPPSDGAEDDWVLVLHDAAKAFTLAGGAAQ